MADEGWHEMQRVPREYHAVFKEFVCPPGLEGIDDLALNFTVVLE